MIGFLETVPLLIETWVLRTAVIGAVVGVVLAGGLLLLRERPAWLRARLLELGLVAILVVPFLPVGSGPHTLGTETNERIEKILLPGGGEQIIGEPLSASTQSGGRDVRWLWWLIPAGIVGFLTRFGVSVRAIRRLHATARQPEQSINVPSVCDTHPVIRVSDRVASPVATGLGRPLIVLPARVLDRTTPAELDHIILHELAHLRRRDPWSLLAQRLLQALLFFHPVVYWVSRRLELERELSCDEWVVSVAGNSRGYARCLAHVAELAISGQRPSLAPAASASRGHLHQRVTALVTNQARRRTPRWLGPSVSVVLVLLALASARFTPTFARPAAGFALAVELAETDGTNTEEQLLWQYSPGHTLTLKTSGHILETDGTLTTRPTADAWLHAIESIDGVTHEGYVRTNTDGTLSYSSLRDGKPAPFNDDTRTLIDRACELASRTSS